MKFSNKDFVSKCDQIRMKLRMWSHLLKKSLLENFIFWAVNIGKSNCPQAIYILFAKIPNKS